jgi:putative addiction module component (TIGR02574 family)
LGFKICGRLFFVTFKPFEKFVFEKKGGITSDMTSASQNIFEQALRLNPVQRAELIDELFRSFDKRPDVLWAVESESRIDAFDAGQISADSAEAVFERISKQ